MIIKPSTVMRNNYISISKLAKQTREPIYLTRNGEGDLMVMDIEAFEEREGILNLREKLVITEINKIIGVNTYSLEEVEKRMRQKLNEK